MNTPQPEALRLADWLEAHLYLAPSTFDDAAAELRRLHNLINNPELVNFMAGVPLEAAHQKERWPMGHDSGKTPEDWYWLIGHLSGRALSHHKEAERLTKLIPGAGLHASNLAQQIAYHREKAVHHTITTAAACANWHGAIVGNLGKAVAPADLVRAAGEVA